MMPVTKKIEMREKMKNDLLVAFRNRLSEAIDSIFEVAFKRVIRKGKIIRKVKNTRGANFRIVRHGNQVKFVRKTAAEKRKRRLAMKKAWRKGKAARLNKIKRTIRKSRIRMKSFYRK